jgi:hypothetical protein
VAGVAGETASQWQAGILLRNSNWAAVTPVQETPKKKSFTAVFILCRRVGDVPLLPLPIGPSKTSKGTIEDAAPTSLSGVMVQ